MGRRLNPNEWSNGDRAKVPARACHFSVDEVTTFSLSRGAELADDAKDPVRFTMLVNSGKPIENHGWWGSIGIDLAGVEFKQRMPALENHDTQRRLGFTEKIEHVSGRGLVAQGVMLGNPPARQIIADSRQGFPFQASCYLKPKRVQVLDDGETAEVNGYTIKGPGAVFRESTMREVTFCPLGADSETSAETLDDGVDVTFSVSRQQQHEEPMKPKVKNNEPAQPAAAELEPITAGEVATVTSDEGADETAAERERVDVILSSASAEQMDLARELVKSGAALTVALSRLNQDLRDRLKKSIERPFAEPNGDLATSAASLGEALQARGLGNSGRLASTKDQRFAVTASLPDGPEKWSAQFAADPGLRAEFFSEKHYLAFAANQKRTRVAGFSDLSLATISQGPLAGFGYRNVIGSYFMRLEERNQASWVSEIASVYTSDQPMETYKFLGASPAPAKWSGERRRQGLADFGIKVMNDKYEDTIEVDIDDLRRDKTGQLLDRINDLAAKVATLPQRLITALLETNPTCYDGVALYSGSHSVGNSGTTNNDLSYDITDPDNPTSAEMVQSILSMITSMVGFKDDSGDPANAEATRFGIMVPTKYLPALTAALQNDYTSAGVSNTLKNSRFQIVPFINPRLNGAATSAGRRFYGFRLDAGIRSLLWQDEEIGDAFKVLGPESDNGFWRDSVAFGAKRLGNAAPGRFELTARGTFS